MLWGCYKIVNHEFSTLFYYLRTLPSFNPVTWSWGLWEMWLPLNEPSIAKKQHGLPASGGCVWGRPRGGEPHTADQACSTRFRRSLGDAAPQGRRRPQVSEHTHLLLLCNTTSPLHWKKKQKAHFCLTKVMFPAYHLRQTVELWLRVVWETRTDISYWSNAEAQLSLEQLKAFLRLEAGWKWSYI